MTWLERLYAALWRNTTGEPYTFIMRRHPWLLPVALIPLLLLSAFGLILTGHVYW